MGDAGLGQMSEASDRAGRFPRRGIESGGLQQARQARPRPGKPQEDPRPADLTVPEPQRVQGNCQNPNEQARPAPEEVGDAGQQLGHGHQREHRRRPDQARLRPQAANRSRARPAKAPPRSRRPTPPKAVRPRRASTRGLPEVPQDDRGRPQQRADPPRPSPDHPPLFRADPSPRDEAREAVAPAK